MMMMTVMTVMTVMMGITVMMAIMTITVTITMETTVTAKTTMAASMTCTENRDFDGNDDKNFLNQLKKVVIVVGCHIRTLSGDIAKPHEFPR